MSCRQPTALTDASCLPGNIPDCLHCGMASVKQDWNTARAVHPARPAALHPAPRQQTVHTDAGVGPTPLPADLGGLPRLSPRLCSSRLLLRPLLSTLLAERTLCQDLGACGLRLLAAVEGGHQRHPRDGAVAHPAGECAPERSVMKCSSTWLHELQTLMLHTVQAGGCC